MQNFQNRVNTIIIVCVTLFGSLFSCKLEKNDDDLVEEESFEQYQALVANRQLLNDEIEAFLTRLPSPTEILFKLESEGVIYNESLINNLENADSYLTHSDITAINLGVYAADIAYLSAFDKYQKVIYYLEASRKMSDYIGVTSAFDIKIMEEYKEKFGDKSAIESLINQSIRRTAGILRTDERAQAAILFLAGAYIEALHISSYQVNPNNVLGLAGLNDKNEIIVMIRDQEESLDGIIDLLQQLDSDETIDAFILNFQALKDRFQGIKTDQEDGITDPKYLIEFAMEVNAIRTELISSQI